MAARHNCVYICPCYFILPYARTTDCQIQTVLEDEYLKWIHGFANHLGGRIFIDIDDKGTVSGLTDAKKLLENIPNKIVKHLGLVVDVKLHV